MRGTPSPETGGERASPERGTPARPVTFSCSSRSRATSGARSGAEAEAAAWGSGSAGASMAGRGRAPGGLSGANES